MAELTTNPTPTTGKELQVAQAHRRRWCCDTNLRDAILALPD